LRTCFRSSRTPVREALYLLASEGLVVPTKRGFMVREFTPSEIVEIYEVRAGAGGHGGPSRRGAGRRQGHRGRARGGGRHGDAGEVGAAGAGGQEHPVPPGDLAAAGNERLGRLNGQHTEHFFNYRIADLYTDEEAAASIEGHRQIEVALRKRDGDAAEKAARDHILEALSVTLRKLR